MVRTGIFVRGQDSEGKWRALDLAELDENQLREFFKRKSGEEELRGWCVSLVKWIQTHLVEAPKQATEEHANPD